MLTEKHGGHMPAITITGDATIADIVGRLNKPMEYVRSVLEHMWECRREFGSASVRIGVMGEGRAPNYRLEYAKEGMSHAAVFKAYNGLSHKPIEGLGQWNLTDEDFVAALDGTNTELPPTPDHTLRGEHWSSRVMRLEDVSTLLGQLRTRKR
jgi:hypothetical protein